MKKLRILGSSAGNGVCLIPFLEAPNYKLIGNNEIRAVFYTKKDKQWLSNFPDVPQFRQFNRNLRPDIIIGHPDCGDSSILRMSRAKKSGKVEENQSITLYLNSITHYEPKFFLLENLPGLLKTYSLEFFEKHYTNYHIISHISSVAAFGNSQVSRNRLIIVGVRKDIKGDYRKAFKLPKIKYSKLKLSQEFELGKVEIKKVCHVRESSIKTCNLYYKDLRTITYNFAEDLWQGKYNGMSRWPVGGKMKNQPGVTRNLKDSFPFTVRKQNRQFGTQGLVLSPREMASIQGVPYWFKLYYDEAEKIYWLNKGRTTVTKTMPVEVAAWFKNGIDYLLNF